MIINQFFQITNNILENNNPIPNPELIKITFSCKFLATSVTNLLLKES